MVKTRSLPTNDRRGIRAQRDSLANVLYSTQTGVSINGGHYIKGNHLQRNRRKSAIQKIYDGRGNFNDGCVASGARLLRRLRCSTLTT